MVHGDGDAWEVDVRLEGSASGARHLRANSCASVARASALIIALAIDPEAAARAADELEAHDEPSATATPPPASPPPSSRPAHQAHAHQTHAHMPGAARTPSPWSGHVFGGAALEAGILPGVAAAPWVGGGIAWRFLRADAALTLLPSATTRLADESPYGARFWAIAGELRGCIGHTVWRAAMYGCVGARASHTRGRGTGPLQAMRDHAELLEARAGAVLRVPAHTRMAAELTLHAGLPATRPQFVLLDEAGREVMVQRPPPLTLHGALALSYRF